MSDAILAAWATSARPPASTRTGANTLVIPDGCRDLIMRVLPGQKPRWTVSALQDRTISVEIKPGERLEGYRLRPWVRIDEAGLLGLVREREADNRDLSSIIDEYCRISAPANEALECLAQAATVAGAAVQLGVSQRCL